MNSPQSRTLYTHIIKVRRTTTWLVARGGLADREGRAPYTHIIKVRRTTTTVAIPTTIASGSSRHQPPQHFGLSDVISVVAEFMVR
jgi:hypothetical protein